MLLKHCYALGCKSNEHDPNEAENRSKEAGRRPLHRAVELGSFGRGPSLLYGRAMPHDASDLMMGPNRYNDAVATAVRTGGLI